MCARQGAFTCQTVAPAGAGTAENPYQISSLENLLWMAEEIENEDDFRDNHFQQINDIDTFKSSGWFDGKGFLPIGGGGINCRRFQYLSPVNGGTGTHPPHETC